MQWRPKYCLKIILKTLKLSRKELDEAHKELNRFSRLEEDLRVSHSNNDEMSKQHVSLSDQYKALEGDLAQCQATNREQQDSFRKAGC